MYPVAGACRQSHAGAKATAAPPLLFKVCTRETSHPSSGFLQVRFSSLFSQMNSFFYLFLFVTLQENVDRIRVKMYII